MRTQALTAWRETYDESAQAPTWLEAHRWTYGPKVAQATIEDVRRKLELKPTDEVLEVGCGSGAFLMGLLEPRQRGVGLDLCESLVRSAPRLQVDINRIKLGVAEATQLPVGSDCFDKVLCYSVAHHFPDREYARQVIHQLIRVCRVGGVVLLGDISGVMERHRKVLIQSGMPRPIADGMLTAIEPLRYFRWLPSRRANKSWAATYRRSFFQRVLKCLPCKFEFLDQDIPGRAESLGRFDVRIRKCGPLRRFTHKVVFMAVAILNEFEGFMGNVGSFVHG